MSNEWYYRLGDHDDSDGFLWSGRINTGSVQVSNSQARELIRIQEGMKRLPARTIVMSLESLRGERK